MSYLILSRRVGEALIVGDNISVTVLDITDKRVRIGVHALDHCMHLEIALEHDVGCEIQPNVTTSSMNR